MGTCFFARITEAFGIDGKDGRVNGATVSSGTGVVDLILAKDTEDGCISSFDALLSGNDWQDSKHNSRQQLSSFMGIGFLH